MKTVSSICAAGSLTALSAVGLALGRPNEGDDDERDGDSAASTRTRHPADMATVVHYPLARESPAFAFPNIQQSRRLPSSEHDGGHLADLTVEHKRRSATSKGGTAGRESEGGGQHSGTPSSWMRRLSSNVSSTMSSSRDSSRAPTSRPASAALSYTNMDGSTGVSHSGSTTSVFTPPSRPPNKLVKRTPSAHSTRGSPFDAGSRLPVLRRPATSHQRSATLQVTYSNPQRSTRDCSPWRHYFTPRVAAADATARRGSTGIPNPIKRVYPDRKHIPTLISAKELVRPAAVELEGSEREEDFSMVPSTASLPFPSYEPHFEESTVPRRSFSISELLGNASQPRTRPSSARGRPWSSRSLRIARPMVVPEPQVSMGIHHSRPAGHESERPAKRRSLADPRISQRSNSTPSTDHAASHERESHPNLDPEHQLAADDPRTSVSASRAQTPPPPPPLEQQQLPSATLPTPCAKPARLSNNSNWEITSISADSDSDARSLGDNSTDYQSDNVYDSYPTRTTRSSSGRRGPHIETIFDESPPSFSSGRSTKLKDLLSDSQFSGASIGDRYRHSTIEEEDSVISTPVRSLRNKSVTSTPSARPGAPHVFSSSPPMMNMMPDHDDIDWDAPEEGGYDRGLGIQPRYTANGGATEMSLPFRFGPNLHPAYPHSLNTTPHRNGPYALDKAKLFDWAEQQPSPSHASNSPPRPRTVHGKKDPDSRWSRPTGRRGPSAGMHARSHSVPVVPDLDGKRDTVAANKFGTWGVGSKAVTEDWNEDFDFDEPLHLAQANVSLEEKRIDSGHEMFVPKSIREQQANVVANIGLLREWGLLIEELKELRIRAVALDMMIGPYQQAWREVDAMIDLADQESEEHTLEPRGTPPSSPGFDYSAFEDHSTPQQSPAIPLEHVSSLPDFASTTKQPSTPQSSAIMTRPRKDSELVAQTVIAALQSRRGMSDSTIVQPVGPSKKVPFDTATLRHIVPYVNGLKRRVKDALRETEGLYSSPRRRSSPTPSILSRESPTGAPAFRSIFNEPQDDITTRRQTRREQAMTDNDGFGSI